MTTPSRPAQDATEAEWQAWVVSHVKSIGGKAYHALNSKGCEPGFPDLVIALPPPLPGVDRPRLIFAELKAGKRQLEPEQKQWVTFLRDCGAVVEVWRFPGDADEVLRVLGIEERPAAVEASEFDDVLVNGLPLRQHPEPGRSRLREALREAAKGGAR